MTEFTLQPLETSDTDHEAKKKPYAGINRRLGERRKNSDRRAEARFTVGKTDRRQSRGRRSTDLDVSKRVYKPKYESIWG